MCLAKSEVIMCSCVLFQIVHKQLTCESVLIFENFVLKLTNFDISSSDQPEKPSTSTRAVSVHG